jgi:hypothetical protein
MDMSARAVGGGSRSEHGAATECSEREREREREGYAEGGVQAIMDCFEFS